MIIGQDYVLMYMFRIHQKDAKLYLSQYGNGPVSVQVNNFTDNTNKNVGISLQTEWQLGENNYLIAGIRLSDR